MNIIKEAFRNEQSKSAYLINDVVALVIVLSIIAIILESVEGIGAAYQPIFLIAEITFTAIFAIEYAARLAFAKRRVGYAASPLGIIDFLAFFPSLIALFIPALVGLQPARVLRVVRILRLLRLFRILKLFSYGSRRKNGLGILGSIRVVDIEIYLFTLLSVIVISGTLIHLAESGVEGTAFINIPQSMWWATVTITTVGYGDMIPVTIFGRVIAALTMISGLTLFALLITVVGKAAQIVLFGSTVEEEEKIEKLGLRAKTLKIKNK